VLQDYLPPFFVLSVIYLLILSDLLTDSTDLRSKNAAIIIASVSLITAALWFISDTSSVRLFSRDDTISWLEFSEKLLLGAAIILTIGLLGEWPDSDSWKKTVLYTVAKFMVVAGVVLELLGDAGIFESTARLQVLEDTAIAGANEHAAIAESDAAKANKETAMIN
jgi:hypothetical protein